MRCIPSVGLPWAWVLISELEESLIHNFTVAINASLFNCVAVILKLVATIYDMILPLLVKLKRSAHWCVCM